MSTPVTVANDKPAVLKTLEDYRQRDLITRAQMATFIEKMEANQSGVIQLHHGCIVHPGELLRDELFLMNEAVILHQVHIGDFYRKNDSVKPNEGEAKWSDGINWDRKFK